MIECVRGYFPRKSAPERRCSVFAHKRCIHPAFLACIKRRKIVVHVYDVTGHRVRLAGEKMWCF